MSETEREEWLAKLDEYDPPTNAKGVIFGVFWAIIGVLIMLMLVALATPTAKAGAIDQYRAQITREAQFRFGIPAPVPVIAAQIKQESGGNPNAVSRVGASGLMQFMPKTAEWAATAGQLGAPQPTNPQWAIRAGVWYDRWIYDRIRTYASECDRWMFVLASYNGGLGHTYKRQRLSAAPGFWDQTGSLNPGITPSNQIENQTYGPRILLRHQPAFRSWGKTVCLS